MPQGLKFVLGLTKVLINHNEVDTTLDLFSVH